MGGAGESAVIRHLVRSGHFILDRNWRSGAGELDIVAYKGKTLIFVEVKTRHRRFRERFAPLEAITRAKEARVTHLADLYCRRRARHLRRLGLNAVRFDSAGVIYQPSAIPFLRTFQVDYRADAYRSDGGTCLRGRLA